MKFCGNKIEEWLLSGKAHLKNLACGNAGLTQIPVPEGKTFIITKIEVLPFSNIITDTNNFAANITLTDVAQQDLAGILGRSQFQLLFYNERINNTYNIRNKFSINAFNPFTDSVGSTHTAPSIIYEKEEIETFLVVESNSWIYLKFLDFGNTVYQDNYTNIFNGSQNWLPSPFFGYSNQDDIANFASAFGASFDYVPQGYNTNYGTPEFNSDMFTLAALDTTLDPTQATSFIPPFPLGTSSSGALSEYFLNSIPLYNIEYIEVNRRLGTNGLL